MGWMTKTFATEAEADSFVEGLRYVNDSAIGTPVVSDEEGHWEVRFRDADAVEDACLDPEPQPPATRRLRLRVLTWLTFNHVGPIESKAGVAGEGLFAANHALRGDLDAVRILDLTDPLAYLADLKDMSAKAALDETCIGNITFGDARYPVFLDDVEDVDGG